MELYPILAFAVQPYGDGDHRAYLAWLADRGEHHDQDAVMECGYTDHDCTLDFCDA
jgi:hypothetical protein